MLPQRKSQRPLRVAIFFGSTSAGLGMCSVIRSLHRPRSSPTAGGGF
jgi:hypothetical protein